MKQHGYYPVTSRQSSVCSGNSPSVRELEGALLYSREAAIALCPLTLQFSLLPHVVCLPVFLCCLPTQAAAVPCWSLSFIFTHQQLFLLLRHILYRHISSPSDYYELITTIRIRAVNFQTLNFVMF